MSAAMTGMAKNYAVAGAVLDEPNERSLHTTPVPRGGGLAFASISIVLWCLITIYTDLPLKILFALLLPAMILTLIGWLDDKHSLNIAMRLLAQVFAAVIAVTVLNNLPRIGIGGLVLSPGILAGLMIVVWIVWVINLYNFMDGIDGIASVQTIVAATTVGIWYSIETEFGMSLICFTVAAAVSGFLYHNWPPAKIFMGDSGSLFLGGFFAISAVIASTQFGFPLDAFLILLGVFLADATVTLMRRMIRREKWWQAHRSHFYQRAVQSGLSHANVSLWVLALCTILAVFATMRALDIGAAWFWFSLSVIVVCLAAALVMYREGSHPVSVNG